MSSRYFTPTPVTADRAVLTGAEAHHLIHVMRAAPGEQITLFDGSGLEWTAAVRRIGRAEVELDVLAQDEVDRELAVEVTLAAALPKGDRQRWLVEKAVELGVRRIVPLGTARSVAQPSPGALERLRRSVIEASKQCGRNRLLELAAPQAWPELLSATADVPHRWMAHPGQGNLPPGNLPPIGRRDRIVLAIGPEGGFSAEEVAQAVAAGWQLVDLGPRTLRVETAATLLVAMVALRATE
jgi:16S rRNA (uracil1498-N3)-methyltransferase